MPCLCGLRLSRTNAVSNNLPQWQKDKDDGQSRDVRWDGGDGAVKGLGVASIRAARSLSFCPTGIAVKSN